MGFSFQSDFTFKCTFAAPGPYVIGDSQAAAPIFRRNAPGQRRQQRLRIGIRNRQHRNFGDGRGVFHLQTLGVFGGAHSRSERIARIKRHVGHAAALRTILGTPGSRRKRIAFHKSVFVRIGINQAAHRAVLGRDFRLDAAPGMKIAGDHDLALHGNTHALQLFVIFRNAVVHVNQRRGNISVLRISVIGGQLLGLLVRRGILRQRRLLQLGGKFRPAFDQFHHALHWRGKKHVELFDVGIETELLEFRREPLGVFLVVGRTDVVRDAPKDAAWRRGDYRDWEFLETFLPTGVRCGKFPRNSPPKSGPPPKRG